MEHERIMVETRDYRIDNIKGILIILVVFGHLLELILKENNIAHSLYCLIYSFHMPVFIFTTGYFAKFDWKKIGCQILYPYLLFQTFYIVFARVILHDGQALVYGTPYWLLWYLLAVFIWTITMPLWNHKKKAVDIIVLLLSILVAVFCGKLNFVGREYTLSRILVFFPFFIAGTFIRKWSKNQERDNISERKTENINKVNVNKTNVNKIVRIIILLIGITVSLLIALHHQQIDRNWLYEATSYEASHYTILIRSIHLVSGFLLIIIAMNWIPNRCIPVVNNLGKNTMQIFLLHGFIVKLLEQYGFGKMLSNARLNKIVEVMILFVIAMGITYLLSLPAITRLMQPLTSLDFFWKRSREK